MNYYADLIEGVPAVRLRHWLKEREKRLDVLTRNIANIESERDELAELINLAKDELARRDAKKTSNNSEQGDAEEDAPEKLKVTSGKEAQDG